MSYDRKFLRLTFIFDDNSSAEMAETGLHLTGDTGFDALAALASPTDADLKSFGTTLGTTLNAHLNWANYSRITAVKLAAISTAGAYLAEARLVPMTTVPAGTQTDCYPQCTVECGLWSGQTFGRANYGKMYMPHTRLVLDTNSSVSTTARAASAATDVASWITGLNGSAGGWPGSPVVKNLSKVGSGTTKTVTTIRVGIVTDTQRRRRDALQELRQTHSV